MTNEVVDLQKAMDWVNRKRIFLGTGLQLPSHMTLDEHVLVGTYLGQVGDAGAWGRADQANRVQDEVRAMASSLCWSQARYNKEIAARYAQLVMLYRTVSIKTILNNAATGRVWPHEQRRQTQILGYGHHEALNKYNEADRNYWLSLANRMRWPVYMLRQALTAGQQPPDIDTVVPLFGPLLNWGVK